MIDTHNTITVPLWQLISYLLIAFIAGAAMGWVGVIFIFLVIGTYVYISMDKKQKAQRIEGFDGHSRTD
jgi:hypothetical protein